MYDFLSKKGLQEKLKSKWADLLIHGDATILTDAFGFNKFFVFTPVFWMSGHLLHDLTDYGQRFEGIGIVELFSIEVEEVVE